METTTDLKLVEEVDEHSDEVIIPQSHGYLFCMKPRVGKQTDRNQWIAVALCKKTGCDLLVVGEDGTFDCHCPPSIQYYAAIRKLNSGELDNIRKQRKAGRKEIPEEEEEE